MRKIDDTEFIINPDRLPKIIIHDNDRLVTYLHSTKRKG